MLMPVCFSGFLLHTKDVHVLLGTEKGHIIIGTNYMDRTLTRGVLYHPNNTPVLKNIVVMAAIQECRL